MRIDLLFHFLVSFICTVVCIFALMFFIPTFKNNSPRFWHSEKTIRNHFLIMIFCLAAAYTFVIGIGKEWLDYWGMGNVQMSDVIADVSGILVGGWMMMELIKQRYRKRRRIKFLSSAKKQSNPHVNLFRHSIQKQRSSSQPKIQKSEHASFLFDQQLDDEDQ